jgi:hypothetical protein
LATKSPSVVAGHKAVWPRVGKLKKRGTAAASTNKFNTVLRMKHLANPRIYHAQTTFLAPQKLAE